MLTGADWASWHRDTPAALDRCKTLLRERHKAKLVVPGNELGRALHACFLLQAAHHYLTGALVSGMKMTFLPA